MKTAAEHVNPVLGFAAGAVGWLLILALIVVAFAAPSRPPASSAATDADEAASPARKVVDHTRRPGDGDDGREVTS